ncbi:acetyl-CoA carboxylase biotin carboxyl carrier protein [Mycoplana sp. BE70]|uniref:biotin/lipoyl-containing protein n=1 Tax=Mycoplana sp. BE70 TaxID=2817775 RepID=UPI0028679A80|nr:biotin/lipoyl-containing protein [Mycoplana sp. BE70]MDR6759323.1 acetyl-CoA carboxylase biotin carboxyl carrier protein [Mycoplana sp. BE70]
MTIKTIEAMLPGVIYLSSSPDAAPFKTAGDRVAAGETVALVEVMKSFLPVEADADGIFLGYSVENESNIEPGETVCQIEAV